MKSLFSAQIKRLVNTYLTALIYSIIRLVITYLTAVFYSIKRLVNTYLTALFAEIKRGGKSACDGSVVYLSSSIKIKVKNCIKISKDIFFCKF